MSPFSMSACPLVVFKLHDTGFLFPLQHVINLCSIVRLLIGLPHVFFHSNMASNEYLYSPGNPVATKKGKKTNKLN